MSHLQVGLPLVLCTVAWGITDVTRTLAEDRRPSSGEETRLIIVSIEGKVEFSRSGSTQWDPSYTNQVLVAGDRLRTGERSRASARYSNTTIRIGALSYLEIPQLTQERPLIRLFRGLFYFFHRDPPGQYWLNTPTVSAIVRGTDINVGVAEDGTTTFTVLNGAAEVDTESGRVELGAQQQIVAAPGLSALPVKTSVLQTIDLVQWCLYYPGVLRIGDLGMTSAEQAALDKSLVAYQWGDLKAAVALYPTDRISSSAEEKVYLASLLVSVGEINKAGALLRQIQDSPGTSLRLAHALRMMIDAVARTNSPIADSKANTNRLATEWLALSYAEQSQFKLEAALKDARRACEIAPDFGFAWERVAELEFSFGRIGRAKDALERSLELAPRNAQAMALKGFLLAAEQRTAQAFQYFDKASTLDGGLGNAWLGRGLCLIHQGHIQEGRIELQVAATLEPNRSVLRSYLGKAWSQSRNDLRAASELALAKRLDPNDPTPWLYSALIDYNQYRTAEAINAIDESKLLNTNRLIYRSRLLLDEDQAVRSANLANIYKDVGMVDASIQEAGRAVAYDQANSSGHLNLASTYDQLRDPTRFNLRYETPTLSELMLADLLAPPGANSVSENLSQQEYSRLFAANHIGLNQTAEVYSDGDYRQRVTQYGTRGTTSWASDLYYQYKSGFRVNNDLSNIEWNTRIKQQITPQDAFLLLTEYEDYNAGDQFQYYDPSQAHPTYRISEMQAPLLFAGWDHEWTPGSHTLFLAERLDDDQHVSDTDFAATAAFAAPPANPVSVPFALQYQSQWEIYTAEISQILQRERHTDVFGMRFQDGRVNAQATLSNPAVGAGDFTLPDISVANADLRRFSGYEYHHWEIVDGLMLIAGVSFDDEQYPSNFRRPPLSRNETEREQWSPKAAAIWSPSPSVTLRGVFSQTLGGVGFEESTRLEPTQLAGFVQAYRSLIPETLAGEVEAPRYQISGVALDWRMTPSTWVTLQGQSMTERVDEQLGIFLLDFSGPSLISSPTSTTESYDYEEDTARLTFNHILEKDWFLQGLYQYSHSELKTTFPSIAAAPSFSRLETLSGDLQQLSWSASWQPPWGFLARAEVSAFFQDLGGSESHPIGRSFAQANLYCGYRFRNRRAELDCGLLNLTGDDFHLNPINYYLDLPHQRLFYSRFRFSF